MRIFPSCVMFSPGPFSFILNPGLLFTWISRSLRAYQAAKLEKSQTISTAEVSSAQHNLYAPVELWSPLNTPWFSSEPSRPAPP
jgi:hypothetical protein